MRWCLGLDPLPREKWDKEAERRGLFTEEGGRDVGVWLAGIPAAESRGEGKLGTACIWTTVEFTLRAAR